MPDVDNDRVAIERDSLMIEPDHNDQGSIVVKSWRRVTRDPDGIWRSATNIARFDRSFQTRDRGDALVQFARIVGRIMTTRVFNRHDE